MFTLKRGRLPAADVKNIIFFVRPRLELMDIIAENVLRYLSELMFGPKEVGPLGSFNILSCSLQPRFLASTLAGGILENWDRCERMSEGEWETCEVFQFETGHLSYNPVLSGELDLWTCINSKDP